MRRDGTEFPVELTVTRSDVDGEPLFIGFLRDLTDAHAARDGLQRTQAALALVGAQPAHDRRLGADGAVRGRRRGHLHALGGQGPGRARPRARRGRRALGVRRLPRRPGGHGRGAARPGTARRERRLPTSATLVFEVAYSPVRRAGGDGRSGRDRRRDRHHGAPPQRGAARARRVRTTGSPASPTARGSRSGCAAGVRDAKPTTGRSRCSTSTSTTSRRSTTRSATARATSCCARSPGGSTTRIDGDVHARPPRRRRVHAAARRPARRRPGRRRGRAAELLDALRRAVLDRRRRAAGGREHRHQPLSRRCGGRRRPAQARRRRDVPGEARRTRRPRAVPAPTPTAPTAGSSSPRACAPPCSATSSSCTTSRCSTSATARARRRRGARALERPGARDGLARRVHPAGRGHRADRADRRVGAWTRPAGSCARGRTSASMSSWRSTPPRASSCARASPAASASGCRARGAVPGSLTIEIIESALVDADGRLAGARGARRHGRQRGDRRLRRRLLVADPPARPHRPHAQARPRVPPRRAGRRRAAAFITAMLALARELGLEVVAEGIETPAQLGFLLSEGCPRGQGYHLGAPDAGRRA